MNIIKWKCGCIQIENEPIFLFYCEAESFTDFRLNEYIFDYDDDRKCEPPYVVITDNIVRFHILKSIAFQSKQAYSYRQFKSVLKDMVK